MRLLFVFVVAITILIIVGVVYESYRSSSQNAREAEISSEATGTEAEI
jgi:CHASE3 domain sensor protein